MSLYLPDLEAVFVHVPKAAGTWVGRVLQASGIRCEPARGVGTHNHPAAYADRGRRFMFVRQPWEWYQSAWRGLHSSWPLRSELRPLHRERTWSPIRNLTYLVGAKDFTEFCENVVRFQPGFCSRMFEWYAGPPGYPLVDYVGRQEHAREDLQTILGWLGWAGRLADVPPENVGPVHPMECREDLRRDVIDREFGYQRWYPNEECGPFRVES